MTVNPVSWPQYLGDVVHPADKRTLVEHARARGADDDVVRTLESLPVDRFDSAQDVREAFGHR
ncbi:DUF2795 domain-containing protein [Dactylosporangium sp. NPDC051541]|uniref:DUF2795 domain-containing protein n=1 Tax=Dactylosporangium sp. NPDC051541 TaxID=3363977 RepID=UPI00379A94FD